MQLRRPARTRLALAALAFALPALTSCGFDYATDRVYTPGAGVNERSGTVDVLAGVIVSARPGSGTLVATLSNNSTEQSVTLDQVVGSAETSISTNDFQPVEVSPGGFVDLSDEPGAIEVTGDFRAGDFVGLAFAFDNGERVTLQVPVEEEELEYAGLDVTGEPPPDDPAGEADPADVEESDESH